ncbi:MAG TPA: hypothetical protein VF773_15230 [Verrucomicrobiae bacterium]
MRTYYFSRIIAIGLLFGSVGLEAATNGPSIGLSRISGQPQISFTGTLQVADSVTGAWTDLTNAPNPYALNATNAHRFFRSRDLLSIFSSDEIVQFSVTGALQEHFELAHAGMPDGIFPPIREKPYFGGTIHIGQQTIPVDLRVRGNSSLQECFFPKMKFKVSRTNRIGTPFFDAREVKIGTHCAEGGRGPIGRLRDERATYREALAYEIMQMVGFVGPRVRRARIDYFDTSSTNRASEVGWSVTRNAVILDDVEVVAEGLGGRALNDEEVAALTNANFSVQLKTEIQILQVLLGNWDYALSTSGEGLWNIDVIELRNKTFIPVPGDFDLCSFVTEELRLEVPWDYRPELPQLERQTRYHLERIRGEVEETDPEIFPAAKLRFESKRNLIEARIAAASIDEPGRTNAASHVTAFFGSLAEMTDDRE